MREQSFASLTHPEWVQGRRLWRDGSVNDLIRRIQQGDPTKGWEGDPRLEVYYQGATKQWELWRMEADGTHRRVMWTDPGAPFDGSVIDELIASDTRRGFDVHKHLMTVNQSVNRKRSEGFSEWVREEIAPRVAHAARKGRLV